MSRSPATWWIRFFLAALGVTSVGASLAMATPAAAQNDGQWWHLQWEMDKVRPISDGSGVTVALLDSGVDTAVPELARSVIAGTDLISGGDGTSDHSPDSHGTAMAALITGENANSGYLGVAPGATILPIAASQGEIGFDESIDRYSSGIRFAVDNGAHVINISLGTPTLGDECPQPVADAIGYAADNDVIVVASSGNEAGGVSEFPGSCAGVVTVGANDAQLNPWERSHRSEYVDVSAPGVSISLVGADGRVGTGSGTSGATALVSGVIALMRANFPDESADTILRRLIYTAGDIHTEGWDDATGYGVVQPYYALTEDLPADAPNPVYEDLEQGGPEATQGGGLQGASPLAPGGSAADEPGSGSALPLVLAVVGGMFVIAILVVVIVVVTASSRKQRTRPPHPSPSYAPQQHPPPRYPPQQYPPQPYQGPPGERR